MKKLVLCLYLCLLATVVHAFIPEPGFWAVDAEVNGQPGRGFQIDLQGSTLVVSFYGYNPDGSAQWYLAAGALTNNRFTAPLQTYRGGMSFGGNAKPAQSFGEAGQIAITFTNATQGTITLPGEIAKPISRSTFARPSNKSLAGAYRLERSIVYINSVKQTYDTARDFTASGTMRIDNYRITQNINFTFNGKSSNTAVNTTYTDNRSYLTVSTNTGITSRSQYVLLGDLLIIFSGATEGTELDYWYRYSADSAASHALDSAPAIETPAISPTEEFIGPVTSALKSVINVPSLPTDH